MEFIVCKFGGTSVATKEKIEQINHILDCDSRRRCVVVSAPGKAPNAPTKVTDLLIAACKNAANNVSYTAEVQTIINRYLEIYEPLGLTRNDIISSCSIIETRLKADTSHAGKFRDSVVALGEDLSARFFAAYLCFIGKKAVYVSPQEAGLIVTPQFGDAQPIDEVELKLACLKKICAESIVVFPGFFGITADGDIATFSRGGSDLTGSIVAEGLDAVEYENFTDVDGILSANPAIVAHPFQIPALTYREMRELSYMGFNVLHEEAVKPIMRKKIPIRLRNTMNLDNKGTIISAERTPDNRVVTGIASSNGYCTFTLEKFLMNREKGFGRKLLSILEEMELSYEHCPSGVDNISVILDQSQLKPDDINDITRTIQERLQPDQIRSEFGLALVAVVGEGLLHKIGILSQATAALSRAGVNIKMANQGSSELSMIFGIDGSDEKKAVNALYAEFFK